MATLSAEVPARLRALPLRRLLHEPLLHFVVLGALLYVAATALQRDPARYRIELDAGRLQSLSEAYAAQYGAAPTPVQLRTLAERYIEEEIAFREGLALQLDRDDEIIRRRIVQKYQFLQQDLSVVPPPGEAQLQRWYQDHAARYTLAGKRSFTQVYFSPDAGGEEQARSRALRAKAELDAHPHRRARELGDAFVDRYDYSDIAQADVERIFGRSELSETLFKLPLHRWAGPFRSGYGWHLVYVEDLQAPQLQPLGAVREQARQDYLEHARLLANEAAMAALRRRYQVLGEALP